MVATISAASQRPARPSSSITPRPHKAPCPVRNLFDPGDEGDFLADFVSVVSDVPDEAITTDTREPSYMFLAAEWNRSSISERAYLLAMLFGREFDVDANALSLQIASIGEPDGSALTARADLSTVSDEDVSRTVAAD